MFNKEAYDFLQNKLNCEPQEDYPLTSRVHPLRSFGPNFFIKREDELGFGISGTKYRKYRTLIPYLKKFKEIIVIGGPFSNHVLGISQLLLENGVQPTLFLKGKKPAHIQGNFFFLKSLIPESSIHWISNWPNVQQIASEYALSRENAFILPEGGAIFPSFLGALTLPLDILRNEDKLGLNFDQIFLDIGTGYSAAALILAFAFLKKQTFCHLLCVAGTEEEFRKTVKILHRDFEICLGKPCPFPENFYCYLPICAKSFGSTNRTLFQSIYHIAQTEGFFLDPIYSGKLFYYAKNWQDAKNLPGNVLLIHSGGALSLSGFMSKTHN